MSFTIRTRLTVWYVTLLALVLAALGLYLVLRLQAGLVAGVDQVLEARAAQIALGLRKGCEGEFRDIGGSSLAGLPNGESGAQLLGTDGKVLESAGDPALGDPLIGPELITQAQTDGASRSTIALGADREAFRVLAARVPAGGCGGTIVVATSLDAVERSVRELTLLLLIAGPVALACAGAGGWLLARRAMAPVARMIGEADDIGIERLDERIEVPPTSDEVQHLAVTLNSMLARLERGLEDKRRFVADASHELRTPLAVMRSELEVSLRSDDLTPFARATLESAQEEVERMRAIVENLLTLARVDAGELQLLRSPADLRAIVNSVTETAGAIARTHGVTLIGEGPAVPVDVDRARIEQVLTNLLANAIRFSPATGTVSTVTWTAEGEAGCTVTDEGPGVPQEMMPRIFERFVRADHSRAGDGGSGLGLAICREIVKAHGGRIWLDTPARGGSAFSFAIPQSDGADEADGDPKNGASIRR